MSSNTPKQLPSTSNRWLSSILRSRASSISVESCLNLSNADPSTPLDARPILPLLASSQTLGPRCKHLRVFSELCKTYKFMHLENVFFTVQDILEPGMPRDARHKVFEFMLACISGQYDELGMARVTFYNSLRSHNNWEDFNDMYNVLFALCKGGRDISGFEKNIVKLLITWMDMTLPCASQKRAGSCTSTTETLVDSRRQTQTASTPGAAIPHLSEQLHLLTCLGKFNFAMFEESEVTNMISATRRAFISTNHPGDIQACLAFTDVVIRYRFVPFDALKPFLEILCAAVMLPNDLIPSKAVSLWPIFTNLLLSHCAHSAILTLCKFLEEPVVSGSREETLANGAILLLSETAWGQKSRTSVDVYMVSDTVLLMYLRRCAFQHNDTLNANVLKSLTLLVENPENTIRLMDWDAVWDICDVCTDHVLGIMDETSIHVLSRLPNQEFDQNRSSTSAIHQFARFLTCIYKKYTTKTYLGPVPRFMNVLYALRRYASEAVASTLMDYYETEHLFLPSADNWIGLLHDLAKTFFAPTEVTTSIRLRMLSIVADVCRTVKDFYSEDIYKQIVLPMMENVVRETDPDVRQTSIDLIVASLCDCQTDETFDRLLELLQTCTYCKCIDHTTKSEETEEVTASSRDENAALVGLRRTHSQSHSPYPHRNQHSLQKSTTAASTDMNSPSLAFATRQDHSGRCEGFSAICGMVELFEELLSENKPAMCVKVFKAITDIAESHDDFLCPYGGPKIVALDLLLRIRCPPNHNIYIISDEVMDEEDIMSPVRVAQEIKRQEKYKLQMANPFAPGPTRPAGHKPGNRLTIPCSTVLSYTDESNVSDAVMDGVLPIDDALKAYITVMSRAPNWDVVLFVLKRLPLQLSNKHLFCGAATQIKELRREIVRWISTRKFLENVVNLPSTTKRNDLYTHAYHLLTVLISYRRHFKKQYQDEIVYTFYVGITQVTVATKPCINALTVCCHELPLSVAKMLNEILQRMSQIISVSSVSVHILEFLSGLARLPDLYANFTGDMYKLVFAIALNYLQFTHSTTQSQSPASTPGPGGSPAIGSPMTTGSSPSTPLQPQRESNQQANQGALSQYVLIMAYLVITVWFTAVPLRERRKHVSFIIQRLLGGNPIGRPIDEQTYTCIDMLSRFSFADVSLSPEKSMVSKILMDGGGQNDAGATGGARQSSRTWVYGHTLLTLKTAKALGWVEMTIRRPSGTVSMMCNIQNKVKSDEIDYKTLPALLMMQYQPDLLASEMMKQQEGKDNGAVGAEGAALGISFEDEATDETAPKEADAACDVRSSSSSNAIPMSRRPSEHTAILTTATGRSDESESETVEQQIGGSPMVRQRSSSQRGWVDQMGVNPGGGKLSEMPMSPPQPKSSAEQVETVIHDILSDPAPSSTQPLSHLRKMEQFIDPGFLYLQLHNYPDISRVIDISPALPDDATTSRTITNLDLIPVVDFHKIGVLYVGKGQRNEIEILANTHGSPEYVKFLNSLGIIQRLRGRIGNTGGLDREMDIDGRYAYFWKDDVTEMVFHVATMMPTNLERDPQCSAKKRHIGNDYVSIVYNDSGEEYTFDTLPGQFNFINVVVSPHSISTDTSSEALWGAENTFFKVEMQRRRDMPEIGPITEPKLVSAQSLPSFIRQTALHANIFAQVFQNLSTGGRHEYLSHWRQRLRHIRRVKERVSASKADPAVSRTTRDDYPLEALLDFARYT
ncbi:Tuberous sclerosis 2-like protein [Apophysomyces sp. BC1034]|nr:Tuberous sclerosis 2-like protein [Apophysomyces sp. BC1015]KAG0178478.1 Tuberous sclerosis 2-like protein [Apophysomyces sp. BC1021]KAG0190087.1 Tuberous sclerosis 2-like protein [Apophysomyces sp. BC1034]